MHVTLCCCVFGPVFNVVEPQSTNINPWPGESDPTDRVNRTCFLCKS